MWLGNQGDRYEGGEVVRKLGSLFHHPGTTHEESMDGRRLTTRWTSEWRLVKTK